MGITLLEENQAQPHVLVNEGFNALDHLAASNVAVVLDGGGAAIAVGTKVYLEVPFACTITGWTILADQSGSIVVDVWKDTYANYPPLVGDTIAGSEKPTISATTKGQDLSLSTWTTSVAAGDILCFNVDSCSSITRATVNLRVRRQ